jgi:hypothetical protein
MLRSKEQRQVLADLELTSVSRSRAFIGVVTTSPPDSAPPTGDESPATYWRERFDGAATDAEARALLAGARAELRHIRRRAFPAVVWEDAVELAARVLGDGEGVDARVVAISLRCTPTFVRRTRVVAGREPEHGRVVSVETLEPRALVAAGMSIRQVAAVVGMPRSTLHGQLAR